MIPSAVVVPTVVLPLSSKFSRNLGNMPKTRHLHMFCRPWESILPSSSWKALGNIAGLRCWRPQVTGRQVTVFLLKVCVRDRAVKSQTSTVSVGIQQGYVLSPLIFIVYKNWTESDSRVDDGVTVGSYRISYQEGLQHGRDRFSAACDRAGMTYSTKKTEVLYCVSLHKPRQCLLFLLHRLSHFLTTAWPH